MSKVPRNAKMTLDLDSFKPGSRTRFPKIPSGFGVDDDSDEDDFLAKPTKSNSKRTNRKPSRTAITGQGAPEPGPNKSTTTRPQKRSRSRSRTRSLSPIEDEAQVIRVKVENIKPCPDDPSSELTDPAIPDVDIKSKAVVCPFCWKKLNDKLSGTSHVKSCGKNLPTERIFDALQLHEKQVKEWEELGIAHPGFLNPTTNSNGARSGKVPRAAGRAKQKKVDPELELAMALSVSLHEEIEDRRRKSDEYLIKIGLEKEVAPNNNPAPLPQQLLPPKPPSAFRVRFGTKAKPKVAKNDPGTESSLGLPRARRGKVNLGPTRLFTVTESERQMLINEGFGEILEISEKENASARIKYKLQDVEVPLGVSHRLGVYRDENCTLWKMASSELVPKREETPTVRDNPPSRFPSATRTEEISTQAGHCNLVTSHCSTQTTYRTVVDQATQTDPRDLVDHSTQTVIQQSDGRSIGIQASFTTDEEPMQVEIDTPKITVSKEFEVGDWSSDNNSSDDSILFLDQVNTSENPALDNLVKRRKSDNLSYCRSPSLSFGKSDSRPSSPPQSPEVVFNQFEGSISCQVSLSEKTKQSSETSHEGIVNGWKTPQHDFEWGNDDSIFEQIPDIMFEGEFPRSNLTPAPRPLSAVSKFKAEKPNSKVKAVATAKIKLPKKLGSTKNSLNSSCSQPVPVRRRSPSPSPMFDSDDDSFDLPDIPLSPVPVSQAKPVKAKPGATSKIRLPKKLQSMQNSSSSSCTQPVPEKRFDSRTNMFDDDFPEIILSPTLLSLPVIKSNPAKTDATSTIKLPKKLGSSKNSRASSCSQPVSQRRSDTPTDMFDDDFPEIDLTLPAVSPVQENKSNPKKTKTGAACKMKLPKKLGTSKNAENASSSQPSMAKAVTPPNYGRSSLTQASSSQTPMLNYSTIDTPLLKAELKKYGLKPLPRSKAKKLLRHIYIETHK